MEDKIYKSKEAVKFLNRRGFNTTVQALNRYERVGDITAIKYPNKQKQVGKDFTESELIRLLENKSIDYVKRKYQKEIKSLEAEVERLNKKVQSLNDKLLKAKDSKKKAVKSNVEGVNINENNVDEVNNKEVNL